jgi:hypothetical protein
LITNNEDHSTNSSLEPNNQSNSKSKSSKQLSTRKKLHSTSSTNTPLKKSSNGKKKKLSYSSKAPEDGSLLRRNSIKQKIDELLSDLRSTFSLIVIACFVFSFNENRKKVGN